MGGGRAFAHAAVARRAGGRFRGGSDQITMTTLNVVLDEMLSASPSGISFYTSELSQALIEHAPPGCFVEGIVASSPEHDYAQIEETLPGLRGLFKSALTRRDLTAAWQHGFTPVPSGMIHATSLFAPLRNHDRVNTRGSQIAVTIHNTTPWTHPEFLASRQVTWAKAMAMRALKYADAVVVPTHAVAAELEEHVPFGSRIRVIGGAVRSGLTVPSDAADRARLLDLPESYLVALASGSSRAALPPLLTALKRGEFGVPLLLVGADAQVEQLVAEANLPRGSVRTLGTLSDPDLAVVVSAATLFVHPSIVDGFGMPVLEAFSLGTPVIHSDAAALVEVAGDASVVVEASQADHYSAALAEAIERVLGDSRLRETLGVLGRDRARLFSWRASAEGIWQLHADL
jgi:glycosyltransferase involved in cell wall biosynthesis